MINYTLVLFAIPLNLLGYLLKHGTKIRNKLIPVIITLISFLFCFSVGRLLGKSTVDSVVNYGFGRGLFVAATSGFGWDLVYGVKTVIRDVTAQAHKLIIIDKEENMDRLKKWHKALFSNLITILIVSLVTFIVGYANARVGTNTINASIDMAILAIVFVSSGLLSLDLIKKIANKDKGLNTQYGICFGFATVAIATFIMAYIATTWTITIITFSVFVISIVLALFCVKYSYLPSLETKEEAIQRVMNNRWEEYSKLTDEEILVHMKKDVGYLFKKNVWKAELDIDKPIFLDNEGNALTVENLTTLNSPEHKVRIANAVKDFVEIIKTREVK